ncbi:hypothetical protein ONZ45_g7089 [Pleurotus djamor]|nr:hypothetical protein ONZ45_g7089 [Pleurotus djamor]
MYSKLWLLLQSYIALVVKASPISSVAASTSPTPGPDGTGIVVTIGGGLYTCYAASNVQIPTAVVTATPSGCGGYPGPVPSGTSNTGTVQPTPGEGGGYPGPIPSGTSNTGTVQATPDDGSYPGPIASGTSNTATVQATPVDGEGYPGPIPSGTSNTGTQVATPGPDRRDVSLVSPSFFPDPTATVSAVVPSFVEGGPPVVTASFFPGPNLSTVVPSFVDASPSTVTPSSGPSYICVPIV